MLRVLVAALVGAVVGGVFVRYSGVLDPDARDADPAVSAPLLPEHAPAPGHATDLAEPARAPVASTSERAPDTLEPEGLISAALRRHADAGLRDGWKAVRKDDIPAEDLSEGMGRFEKLVLESPLAIGRQLGERRTKAEEALADARSGGVFALLDKLDAGGVGPLPALVRDPAQLEPLFARMVTESSRNALADRTHPDAGAEDGVTLSWPGGVYSIKGLMQQKDPYPRDVTIEGAGMDATMLVLGGQLMTRGELRNFTIRDCTVHTNNNYLFDLRLKPAAVRLERVRFVGFDMGAGASCLFGTRGLALWARSCRFDGGYGRSPQHGTIFDVRTDGLIARFDNCTLSLVNLNVHWIRPGATVLFAGCALEQILDDPQGAGGGHAGVLFDRCSITRFEGERQEVPKLDLNTLFPNWKTRME